MDTNNNFILHHEQENIKLYDKAATSYYRKYDEEYVHTHSYKHLSGVLEQLSGSFTHPITVLDVGCGTGRYFHCLKNLKELTGIDVSHNMLQEARNPYKRTAIPLAGINLIEGNFYNYDFQGQTYDFIYSVGVLGEHAALDEHTANKLFSLLNEGGKLFFTVVDIEPRKNFKRKAAEALYPLLPSNVKKILDKRWETLYMTYDQLTQIVSNVPFSKVTIQRHISQDPKWKGVHLECIAEN